MQQILLKTPSMTGVIRVGDEVLQAQMPTLLNGQKNFALVDENVYALHGDIVNTYFSKEQIYVFPSGEEHKNFQSLQRILEKMTEIGLHRTSRLFAIGGGVVGDIGGLAAALYMRGISCVQIPTTLLAQVDSSVGGKTAVDLGGVKNVVGAFYQPCEVLVCPAFLKTLPQREIKCGLGEIVKYAALSSDIFDSLEKNMQTLDSEELISKLIAVCIQHKAGVVTRDEKETGERKSLNVGHTTGHAIELTYGFSHGEGVLLGMLYETQMAIDAGVCNRAYGEKLLALIKAALALSPTAVQPYESYDIAACAPLAKKDKKNVGDDKVVMSVAKDKGEWTLLSLPYEEYERKLRLAKEKLF
jgi:3-dehydroquinate synthase